jgi:hypothetical protein
MTRTEALNLLAKHCDKTYEELRTAIKKKAKVPCLELLIMRIMESAIAKADIKKLDWIFYQLWGKPKDLSTEQKDRVIHLKYSIGENTNGESKNEN